ncbi:MAG: hypothetical protein ACQEXJ_03765 [Myxococcota bacterium]
MALSAVSLLAPAQTPQSRSDTELSRMSPDEIVDSAQEMVREMEEKLSKSFKLLEESMSAGDVGTTQARNEAITAMKGLVKLSEENLMTMQQAAAEGDRERIEHEYVKISIAAAKVEELFAQVRTAGGIQVDLEAPGVERTLSIESILPLVPELTTTFADPPQVIPDPPIHASPYF